ncbi:long-chain acyl-CoA synthetase [Inquilinus ginsengisoli]|uniref:Long-chain acyl-CoA synthetase n=1 Tax=Inquilinus ginsengisoli TaxID=363840 RepID=A0ABU1JW53_9PROT|nr:long-chain fatty acid--CoA ligase [Inquilinus ginsengisoli]MDR6291799.1 long-chain acyl-CoA synthetase [Inquilinus ginsengisoli]
MTDVAASDRPPAWARLYPPAISWDRPIEPRPLYAILDDAVAQFAGRPCATFMDKTFTYGQIGDLVARAAKGFQAAGVIKGSRVGLFLPNCPYFVICYFALLKCGAVVVNFNPLYAERELITNIDDSGVELMVTLDLAQLHAKLAPLLGRTALKRILVCPMAGILPFPKNLLFPIVKRREVAKVPRDGRYLRWAELVGNDGRFAPVPIAPVDDLAVLQYTGGTTGTPKGAMLTHANLYANTVQAGCWFEGMVPGQDRMLGVLPFFHVFAMTVVMNLSIWAGAEIIMLPRFELDTVMKTIDEKKPTLFPAVPTIYTAIANYPDRAKYDLSSLKRCISGGAPLPLEVKNAFEAATGCKLVEGYGLSESSPIATCNPLYGINKAGSIGIPLPQTMIEIVSLDDRTTVMPTGERGEVCISGPQVMKGYWHRPEESADALFGGRLHTGDVGYMDEDGYTFIVDRIKDMILCSGFNVYPRNVEEAIYLHPAVEECVVAGLPDAYRGQTVKAYVRLRAGQALTAEGLVAFLHDKLSPIEMPKLIEFRDKPLPKTLIGKLSRKALLEEEAAKAAQPEVARAAT